VTGTETGVQERRGLRLLVLAPNPEISGPFPGPIARIAYSLISALRGAGCTVDPELWGRHEADESNAARVAGRARDLARIRGKITSGRFDVVFVNTTHDWRALPRDLLLLFSLPQRVPCVLLYHGSRAELLTSPGHTLFKCATRLLLRRSRAVLVLSRAEARQWLSFSPRTSVHVVSNPFSSGCESPPRRNTRPTSFRVLYAGRLVREKGLFELLEAMAHVVRQEECTLLIAGEGPSEGDLRRLIADLGLRDHVTLLGFLGQEELEAVYAQADMLVLPSYREGFPTVLLEAMSHGLPLVTTPIRGAVDHLIERENVLFVPPQSSRELAEAIIMLARDEPLRRKLGENNLSKVRDFAPERVVQDYLEIFDQVAGRTTSP
jgi:glycosyltransferase involved in cell wall biosynthesis